MGKSVALLAARLFQILDHGLTPARKMVRGWSARQQNGVRGEDPPRELIVVDVAGSPPMHRIL
jgi:hypothetical protein